MSTISYNPSDDVEILKFRPVKGKPTKKIGRFELWWDKEGNLNAIAIRQLREESKEFGKNLNAIQLGGIWRDVKITEKDISAVRKELLRKLEEKW